MTTQRETLITCRLLISTVSVVFLSFLGGRVAMGTAMMKSLPAGEQPDLCLSPTLSAVLQGIP